MESAEKTTNRSDAVERLHEQLQDSLQELVTSEDWQRALAVAARFHDYSFANTRLIWAQSLARGFTPSRVAGYRAWQELERHVRRGERGLQILAPVIRKITPENGEEEERRVVGFRVVHVFDIAQTDGEPLPEVPAALVEGDLPSHWEQVSGLITEAGFELQVADLDRLGEANGITDWQHRDVVVRASLPGAQRFKTAVHELAHVRLHEPTSDGRPSCRGIVEVEAESVAYMVCAALGIDSAGYSLPYVASWSGGDITRVSATANRVIGCARQVLTQLEQERRLEREPTAANPRIEARERETAAPPLASKARSDLETVVSAATAFYQGHLREPAGAEALEYLRGRGIDREAIDRWQLGYAPAAWEALTAALRQEGLSDDLLLEAGVAGRSRHGRLYDRMRSRVIFPINDGHGAPRGFAGRLLSGDGPKYLNTAETELYQKRSLLYGLHLAHQPILDAGKAVVVEGYTDAVAAHQAGLTNVVATGGTALTEEHLKTLARTTSNVTLAFDSDHAGLQAAERAADLDRAHHGIRLHIARLPEGHDPADLLANGGRHSLEEAIANAAPLEHHLIDQIVEQHTLDEPEAMARAIRAARSVLCSATDIEVRTEATKYLATSVGRDVAIVAAYLEETSPHRALDRQRGTGRSLA
ncbi:MAG: toprim domain-containing protein [Acidimicrobiia bacterium]|nr:toprim domain-containing protein [Acidimicrobiia bacterium]